MTLAARHGDDPSNGPDAQPGGGVSTPLLEAFDRALLEGPVVAAARALLGAILVREDGAGRRVARIVETEAYAGPEDRASHARAGRTMRTAVMFGPPGHAYVYLVYGLHHCLNIVCRPEGEASAVLVRAVEALAGTERMRASRGAAAGPDARLGAGPARLCQALDIDRRLDGVDLLHDERLWLARPAPLGRLPTIAVVSGPRVGVTYAGADWAERAWRFGIAGHPSVSRPFPTS